MEVRETGNGGEIPSKGDCTKAGFKECLVQLLI